MYIFYHEFDSTSSGAAVVIINMARGLLMKGEQVLLIAKIDGALHNSLKDIDINSLVVINNDKKSILLYTEQICESDIIITTHYYSVFRIWKIKNPKILFYSVNISSLAVANLYFGKINLKFLTRFLVRKILKGNGLYFIDDFAKEENERQLGMELGLAEFLPIPVEVPDKNEWVKQSKGCKDLILTYVGRAADWKIFPVRKVLKDINNAGFTGRKFTFHIITDNAEGFERGLAGIGKESVDIYYHENLTPKQLNDFLIKNSCLHFAMGTSALDGAKLGIPTVLLDFSFEEFPDNYRYSFLFSAKKYSVGSRAEKGKVFNGLTMADLISLFDKSATVEDFSNRSYMYVKSHHDLPTVTDILLFNAANCRIHMNDISKYLLRYW